MADEIKRVITIDTGNSATTLKEYKQHIDELRGALLQLDETSEEYKDIASEIKTEQDKLNDVMKVGKGYTDAADGSYNQLVQTMSELKKQWRATADEAERADLGNQILDINNKLKDMDASTGNFQRNVGDYAHAFEEAFKTASGLIGNIDSNLGKMTGQIMSLVPLIKTVTATATAGLKGVKKALVSTGIGALIVALGTVLAYWEDISKWIEKATGFVNQHKVALDNAAKQAEELKKKYEDINDLLDYQHDMLGAMGATQEEVLAQTLEDQKKLAEQAFQDEMRLYNDWYLHKDDVDRQMVASRKESADKAEEERKKIEQQVEETSRKLNQERAKLIQEQLEQVATFDESVQAQADILRQHFEEALSQAGQTGRWQMQAYSDYLDGLRQLVSENTVIIDDNATHAAEEAKRRAEEARRQREAELKAAQDILDKVREASMTELELLEKKYLEEKAIVEKAGLDSTALTEKYAQDRLAIIQKYADAEEAAILEAAQASNEARMEWLEEQATQQQFELDNSLVITNEQDIAAARYQIEKDLIDKKIMLQEEYIATLQESFIDTQDAEAQLDAFKQQLANLDMARAKEVATFKAQEEKKAAENAKTAWQSASSSVASILGSIADMMEDGSEEQKTLRIMETTINTLSGAIAAYQSMAGIPYVGPALGVAAAAAVTAAGIANINKIKNTTKGNSGNVSAPETPNISGAAVEPLLNADYDTNRMTALNETPPTMPQDLRVYVVESDISDAGNRAKIRESNSTF